MNLILLDAWRETRRNRRRSLAITLLIATALTALVGLRSAEVIVHRELTRSFVETRPASIIVRTNDIDPGLIETLESLDGVVAVEPRRTNRARIETADGSLVPFILTTTTNPPAQKVNVIRVESTFNHAGAAPIWIESGSFPVLNLEPGDLTEIIVGDTRATAIIGEAVDEGSPPGFAELRVFAYATQGATANLGFDSTLTELRIALDPGSDARTTLNTITTQIQSSGRSISFSSATDIPQHPHATQMGSITAVTRTFALLAALASVALVAQIAASVALAARRQLAMLTIVGASPRLLVTRQLALFAGPALAGLLIGLPAGIWLGAQFGDLALSQLSIQAASLLPPWTTLLLSTGAILGALVVVIVGCSWIVGVKPVASSLSLAPRSTAADRIGTGLWAYPVRSIFRRPMRTLTVVSVLALAGAMMLSSFSLRAGWDTAAENFADRRAFDIAVAVEPEDVAVAIDTLATLPGVVRAEAWAFAAIGEATNPDEPVGSGGSLIAVDPSTTVAQMQISEGAWLSVDARNQVVLDISLADQLGAGIGDQLVLAVYGRDLEFQVAGLAQTNDAASVREAFVDLRQLEARLGVASLSEMVYVQVDESSDEGLQRRADEVDAALSQSGVYANDVQTINEQRDLVANHILPLVAVLFLLGLMAAAIASIGVAITGEINIQERRREIAVLRLLGASADRLAALLATEASLVAAAAAILSIPLAAIMADAIAAPIGEALLGQPVPVAIGPVPSIAWLVASVVVAGLAMTLGTRTLIENPLTTEITQ